MDFNIESDTRARIAVFLPEALRRATESYRDFMEKQTGGSSSDKTDDPAKRFKDHHEACKVAVAHIELLLKLAERAGLPEVQNGEDSNKALREMLALANAELEHLGEDRPT